MGPKYIPAFRRALLKWYERHRRDLPWRRTLHPYPIWLSEVMLQQTRVDAVLDHYRIFLELFPDVETLAAASEDSVLAAWSGLGYYRRARMLHQCAKQIVEKHRGSFPENSEELLELPGIGRYTAAAIASIAFSEPAAVVDGNVERVLQRLTGANLTPAETWDRAQMLLAPSRPGDFNQAMMELGATVCVPREPRCLGCPVQQWCVTRGPIPPVVTIKRQTKRQIWCRLDLRDRDGRVKVRLMRRSKKTSLMAGMWELPEVRAPRKSPLPPAYWRTFRHSITVTDYTVHVIRNTGEPDGRSSAKHGKYREEGKWVAVDEIAQIPITGLTRKILKAGGIIL